MAKYEELKDILSEELDKITKRGEMSLGTLDIIDKLTHSIKSLETILAMNGHSGRSYKAESYAKQRDSMGRYSRDDAKESFLAEAYELIDKAPDEQSRKKLERMLDEMH